MSMPGEKGVLKVIDVHDRTKQASKNDNKGSYEWKFYRKKFRSTE